MSLINDALKRASEAQNQAQTRPRGPKGVEDLPVPMMPAVSRERASWVPVAGFVLVIVALLGASGFFFAQWWKQQQAHQPYATEDIDENGQPTPNLVAKAEPPKLKPPLATQGTNTPGTASTNPPPVVKVAVHPPIPPPEPPKTNPPLVAIVSPTVPVIATHPVVPPPTPPPLTNAPPPKVEPVRVAVTNAPPPPKPPVPPNPPKKIALPVIQLAAVEFPDLKLQGISRGKKKTFVTINGKTLSLGERIEGVTLIKIDADSVTVEKGGAKRELFLLR